jgi:hypothetical protein
LLFLVETSYWIEEVARHNAIMKTLKCGNTLQAAKAEDEKPTEVTIRLKISLIKMMLLCNSKVYYTPQINQLFLGRDIWFFLLLTTHAKGFAR